MIWVLSAYKRTTRGEMVSQSELLGVDAPAIQRSFGTEEGDPVMLAEVNSDEQRRFVESVIGVPLDLRRFSYWIGVYSEDGKQETVTTPSGEVWYLPPLTPPAFPDARPVRPR